MNLRMKIVEQLMSSLFDDDREYLADCEDAALEIMKLIAAEQKPVESEGTIPGPKELAAKYRELMDQRRALIDSGTYSKVDALDEEIDSILNETMLLTQSLLSPESEPATEPEAKPAHIIVVYDKETDHEAIYKDGTLFDCDMTMYASDMVRAIGENTVVNVSSVDVLLSRSNVWPKQFEDLMPYVVKED